LFRIEHETTTTARIEHTNKFLIARLQVRREGREVGRSRIMGEQMGVFKSSRVPGSLPADRTGFLADACSSFGSPSQVTFTVLTIVEAKGGNG
jgi:hypothetical protein